jgi:hypothetical protein
MDFADHTGVMLPIPSDVVQHLMRGSLTGSRATDPVLPEKARRVPRRPARRRVARDGSRFARRPATARQSS